MKILYKTNVLSVKFLWKSDLVADRRIRYGSCLDYLWLSQGPSFCYDAHTFCKF